MTKEQHNSIDSYSDSLSQDKAQSDQRTNRIMGISAIFISLISLFAVIYQSYLSKEENEMNRIQQSASVLPYLHDWYSNTNNEYKLVIENKGVGPAFIKDVVFYGLDPANKDTLEFKSSHQLAAHLENQSSFLDSMPVTKSSFHKMMLLSPNEEKEIIKYFPQNSSQNNKIDDELDLYYGGFKITFEDVYGTAWVLDSNIGFPEKLKPSK